jgi:hypothetical protein
MVRFAHKKAFSVGFKLNDIRNGSIEDIEEMLPRAAIALQYFWIWPNDLPNDALPAVVFDIAKVYAALIRAADSEVDKEEARHQGIVLAAIRTGMVEMFKLQYTDMSPGEVNKKIMTWHETAAETPKKPVPVAGSSAATVLPEIAEEEDEPEKKPAKVLKGEFEVKFPTALKVAAEKYLDDWTDPTDMEMFMASQHISLSVGVMACQGHSIVKCGHHFLSKVEAGQRGAWDGLKKQFLQGFSRGAGEWSGLSSSKWEDVAFHKAGHPVSMALKIRWAQDPAISDKVNRSGWGSIANRLPATEPDFELARVAWALVEKVKVTIVMMGGKVDTSRLATVIQRVEKEKTATARLPLIHDAILMTKAKAYEIAYCAGLLEAMCMQSGQPKHTILNSKGLAKLRSEEVSAGADAGLDYSAYTRNRREMREKGEIGAMSVVFGEHAKETAPIVLEHQMT